MCVFCYLFVARGRLTLSWVSPKPEGGGYQLQRAAAVCSGPQQFPGFIATSQVQSLASKRQNPFFSFCCSVKKDSCEPIFFSRNSKNKTAPPKKKKLNSKKNKKKKELLKKKKKTDPPNTAHRKDLRREDLPRLGQEDLGGERLWDGVFCCLPSWSFWPRRTTKRRGPLEVRGCEGPPTMDPCPKSASSKSLSV